MGLSFFTAGIYGKTEEEFFIGLTRNGIQLLVDTRRRRGLRGSQYAFGNSAHLQSRLKDLKIAYRHELGLAPPEDIRAIQFAADAHDHVSGRGREHIDPAFADAYAREVLDQFDFEEFIRELKAAGVERVAFLCVEARAEACHRSLIARRLEERFGVGKVVDV